MPSIAAAHVSAAAQDAPDQGKVVQIVYTNYRGETAVRRVVPEQLVFKGSEWHGDEQWLLEAYDLDKGALRSFALKDIRACFA